MIKLLGTAMERSRKMADLTSRMRGIGEWEALSIVIEEHLARTRYKPQRNADPILEVILDSIEETPLAPAPTAEAWTEYFMRLAKMERNRNTFMSNLLIELYSHNYAEHKREAAIEVATTLSLFR